MRKAGHFLMCLRATHISTSGDLFASFSLLTYFYSLPLSSAWLMVMILINAASFLPLRSIFSPNIMAFGFCVCLFLSMTIYIFNDHFFPP